MKLLLTLSSDQENKFLLFVNTETEELKLIDFVFEENFDHTSGIVYSGDYLIISIKFYDEPDKIFIQNILTKEYKIFNCKYTKGINSFTSIFPGKLYTVSSETNSLNYIYFDISNLNFIDDGIYYQPNTDMGKYFNSICYYDRKWFVSITKKYGSIIEMSNDRIVYANINYPTSMYFNSNQRLCFLESGKGLFHCDDDIFFINKGNINGIIEDPYNCGYWITSSANRKESKSNLNFIDKKGNLLRQIDLSDFGNIFYNIVEAKGFFSKLI